MTFAFIISDLPLLGHGTRVYRFWPVTLLNSLVSSSSTCDLGFSTDNNVIQDCFGLSFPTV